MTVTPVVNTNPAGGSAQTGKHPGRHILATAPRINAGIRFAPTEKTITAMLPSEAMTWLDHVRAQGGIIDEVEISGPGDPLATPEITMETLTLLRQKFPDATLSVLTLGLFADLFAKGLAENGVTLVTLQVDAVAPEIATKLYAWIRPGKKTVPLAKAAEILLSEQAMAITAFRQAGMEVKIRTTLYPGVNDAHIEAIAKQAAALGATAMTIVPCLPADEEQESCPVPDPELLRSVRALAAKHLSLCEVPAADETEQPCLLALVPKPSRERPNVAVVSSDGMDVDLHLGQAHRILIYGPREDGLACLLRTRLLPESEAGSSRWEKLALILSDCFALLAANAGENPRKILGEHGIKVLLTQGNIEGTVDVLYGGGKKLKCRK